MLWTARAASFLAATSLFLLQPLVARALVPLYGGTSWIWIAVSVFFQLALILGYFAATKLSVQGRARLHARVSALTLVLAPAGFWLLYRRTTFDALPAEFAVFLHLLLTVGVLAVYLAMASPLLQIAIEGDGRIDAHKLYAWSNAGSLIGLLLYPTVMESFAPLRWQMVMALSLAVAAGLMIYRTVAHAEASAAPQQIDWQFPGRGRVAYISAVASALSLAVTTRMTVDLGALPLLWVLPLVMFLLSYIVAFGNLKLARTLAAAAPVALVMACYLFLAGRRLMSPLEMVLLWCGLLFVIECGLQTQIKAIAPVGAARGAFYVTLATGGFVGSFIVGWLIPYYFGAATLLASAPFTAPVLKPILAADPTPEVGWCLAAAAFALASTQRWQARQIAIAGVAAAAVLMLMAIEASELRNIFTAIAIIAGAMAIAYLPAIAGRPWLFGAAITLVVLASSYVAEGYAREMFRTRNVYGVLFARESRDGAFTELYHGTTLHGAQHSARNSAGVVEPRSPQEALSYYHPASPIAAVFRAMSATGCPMRVGILGLGAGALSAFARSGDDYEFYEIDPAVIDAAQGPHFSFVRAARERGAQMTIREGDGRRLLAQRAGPKLDLVIFDAFSSDSVPAHLLTIEAFEAARSQLAPGGYVLFNTSNRYFDVYKVAAANARSLGWDHAVRVGQEEDLGTQASIWVITRPPSTETPGPCVVDVLQQKQKTPILEPVWSDDFSNPLSVLRRQGLWRTLRGER
ncbi:MAG: fused MFS/spermidine synthase [Cyanobacteria bacterium]|nr:fused MFS/spermidine synthase [Cyanobacteriota bacterium]